MPSDQSFSWVDRYQHLSRRSLYRGLWLSFLVRLVTVACDSWRLRSPGMSSVRFGIFSRRRLARSCCRAVSQMSPYSSHARTYRHSRCTLAPSCLLVVEGSLTWARTRSVLPFETALALPGPVWPAGCSLISCAHGFPSEVGAWLSRCGPISLLFACYHYLTRQSQVSEAAGSCFAPSA